MTRIDGRGRLAPHLCGCASDTPLMPVDVALERGLALAVPVAGVERVPLGQATGRVLAAAVTSSVALPPFDNAAMDGWALRRDDLRGPGPWSLPVQGAMRAGDPPNPLATGAACRILTGAALPTGADTVVAQEDAMLRDGSLVLDRRPAPGAHVRRAGGDLAQGALMLPAGIVIGAPEAGALAAAGQSSVLLRRRLRVAVLTTGSELVPPGQPLTEGRIWNASRAMLAAALDLPWIEMSDEPPVPDDPGALTAALADAATRAELVITTGGVSAGDEDHTLRAVDNAGGSAAVTGVAMKPGKPLALGRLGSALWIGLPGNPVAAFVGWRVLGLPLARALAGADPADGTKFVARLAEPVMHRPGRCEYRPARLLGYGGDGALVVECLPDAGSHRVALLARAGGLVLIPSDADRLRAGDLVEFLPF